MTCQDCGWTRIVDHFREYRGSHTDPSDPNSECFGRIDYVEIDTRAPDDPSWFEEEDPSFTPTWP